MLSVAVITGTIAAMASSDPSLSPSTVSVSPIISSTNKAIPIPMDQRLDQVTWDRVSTFAMISLVISTIHPSPLPHLSVPSQFGATHDDNLPFVGRAEVHQKDDISSRS